MKLADLKKKIPYHWKVQTVSKYSPRATCVAYIDARDAMDILDEVVGPEYWQDKYEFVGTKLIAGIGIKCGEEWVWKYDTGTEAQTEAEKSQFSDAFKRACVKWGIGRFLYDLDFRYVDTNDKNTGSNHPYPVGSDAKRIWDLTEYFEKLDKKGVQSTTPTTEVAPLEPQDPAPVQTQAPVQSEATANQMYRLENEAKFLGVSLEELLARYKYTTASLTKLQASTVINALANTPR